MNVKIVGRTLSPSLSEDREPGAGEPTTPALRVTSITRDSATRNRAHLLLADAVARTYGYALNDIDRVEIGTRNVWITTALGRFRHPRPRPIGPVTL